MKPRSQESMQDALLALLREPGFRPGSARELMRRLDLPKESRHVFKRVLRSLLSDRRLARVGRNRYGPPDGAGGAGAERGSVRRRRGEAAPPGVGRRHAGEGRAGRRPSARQTRQSRGPGVIGRLQRHPRGFGFVTPDAGGPDIFLPPPALGALRNGDRVEVRVVRGGRGGRSQGEVVRVLESSNRRVMGVYRSQGGPAGPGMVEAYDRLFESGVLIPEGQAGGARNGLVVGVEITRPPAEGQTAVGRVVEILGRPDEPGVDLRTVIRKYGLETEYPAEVMREAGAIPADVPAAASARREDFRLLPIVTIDGETAMDFDDAVLVRRNPDGGFDLQVHIADVAHYVPAGSPLDREAYKRGTSVYFPGTAVPMLPHALSNGICSLNPGVDRLVQSCLMTIDPRGEVIAHRFAQGVIRSAARMTYTEVARILVDRDAETMRRYQALVPGFRLMEELCGVLNERRRRRGSIDFDLPEPEILLAVTGEMTGIVALQRTVAHRLIEEFMLAANETVARHLWEARLPSLYRIHERPDPRRLEEFDGVAQAFGYRVPGPFTSIEPGALQGMLEMARGRPEERFLTRLMLRSMKQARYAPQRDIHFGLASSCYTHFTSPIRRYPDLVVHRMLKRSLSGRPLPEADRAALEAFLPEAAQHASFMERNADAAESELVAMKKIAFMAERVGEEYEAFVAALQPYGIRVELRELFVEGVIPLESIGDDSYRFIESRHILKGERHGRVFKLGDRLRVRVDRVNSFLLEVDFSLVEATPSRRASRRGGTAPVRGRSRRRRRGRPGS
jgi:ribonuclease R